MNFHYVFMDEYKSPIHIKMHFHNCYELIYYHNANGYSTWKKTNKSVDDNLVFTELEPGIYKKLDFSSNTLVVIPKNILHDEKHFVESKLMAIGFSPDESDKQLFGKNAFDEPFLYHDNHNKIQNIISKSNRNIPDEPLTARK